MSRSGWTWRNFWNLLTIGCKYKYFYHSADWSGLYLELCIPLWLTKIFRFTIFRVLKNVFSKLPCPWHDLIISPHVKTDPQQISPKKFVPICHEKFLGKGPSILYGRTLCPCSFNICREVLTKICQYTE